jgi:DNA-binding LacI/PurR family transcriptional regulator
MKKSTTKVSVGMVARAAGVSVASASVALKNQVGVSAATRDRIVRIARKLGYAPDAKINDWMARVRDAKSRSARRNWAIDWKRVGVRRQA